MNKNILYWIIGIIIVILVIMLVSSLGQKGPASTDGSVQPAQPAASAVRQSIHDLIASGATKTCTFSIAPTASTSGMSGTIYLASGDMRGDFVTTDTAGKATNAHMIIASGTDYLWTDTNAKGVKVAWSVAASSTILSDRPGSVNVNEPADYSCTSATPDQSQFTLPTTISFTDVTSMVKSYNSKHGTVGSPLPVR